MLIQHVEMLKFLAASGGHVPDFSGRLRRPRAWQISSSEAILIAVYSYEQPHICIKLVYGHDTYIGTYSQGFGDGHALRERLLNCSMSASSM